MSSDKSSDEDELGLFSFPNKKAIVCTPPSSPKGESCGKDNVSPIDRNMFRKNKRKRLTAPNADPNCTNANNQTGLDDSIGEESKLEPEDAIQRLNQQYDERVENICKIDESLSPVSLPKRMKKSAEKRVKLLCDITGVLNKFKNSHDNVNAGESSSETSLHNMDSIKEEHGLVAPCAARSFMLKLQKGSNVHRFKITMDTPLEIVLQHLAPVYTVSTENFLLQLNDENLDSSLTPSQLGLTVADIIEVLVISAPVKQSVPDDNLIMIKVQSTAHRNNVREYKVIKHKPLKEYLTQACKDFGYDAAKYFFDGDAIDPKSTALDLELEDGDCFDIVEQT